MNFGYQGISSIIDALVNRKDVIVYDAESHACIIDGARLHMGKRFIYAHNDMESFEKQLVRAERICKESGGGILVITEGVFGMSGNVGNLKEIVKFKDRYQFRLLVDDAHGFGTMGKTGAGVAEEMGVGDKVDLYFSTFAKSMASIGAFVAGDKKIIEYLRYNIRSQLFAKSLPMPLVIGKGKADQRRVPVVVPDSPQRAVRRIEGQVADPRVPEQHAGPTGLQVQRDEVTPIGVVGGIEEGA